MWMSVIYSNEGFVWEAVIIGGLLLLPKKLKERSRYFSIVSNDDESPITESIQMKRWSNGWEPWLLTKLSRFESYQIVFLLLCTTIQFKTYHRIKWWWIFLHCEQLDEVVVECIRRFTSVQAIPVRKPPACFLNLFCIVYCNTIKILYLSRFNLTRLIPTWSRWRSTLAGSLEASLAGFQSWDEPVQSSRTHLIQGHYSCGSGNGLGAAMSLPNSIVGYGVGK